MTEPVREGRHEAPGQRRVRFADGDGLLVRLMLIVLGVVAGVLAVLWRWVVRTPLLGARLPTTAHVLLVGLFLAVMLAVAVLASRRGYRALAQWSQTRRRRQRNESP